MKEGEQFLHQQDPDLHVSEVVEHEKERKEIAGQETPQKPAEKIASWLKLLELSPAIGGLLTMGLSSVSASFNFYFLNLYRYDILLKHGNSYKIKGKICIKI